jgi:hypothetical protein
VPALTRRRMQDVHQETWLIFYDDIRVGTIAERSGVPLDLDRWGWSLGFYLKSDRPGDIRSGTAATFKLAREAFNQAWQDYLPTCTAQDFLVYRRRRASEAWKHAMWAAPALLPTQTADGRSRCFCGAEITIATTEPHIYEAHMDLGRE